MATRVAVDIGGTFTDLVSFDDVSGKVELAKTSTTPPQFEEGVLRAIEESDLDGADFLAHGTTVVINALTERRGAVTALVTTRGCRDVLEIARGNRPDLYNVRFEKPLPFVPRRLRFEVDERLNYKGQVLRPLDEETVRTAVDAAVAAGAESIAFCFLHSYANPAHERRALEVARELWPEIPVTASHEITKEWREYDRSSTVVLDAYVKPAVRSYLGALSRGLSERAIPETAQHVMQSNGGISRFGVAVDAPINLIESGPVGGVIGAAAIGAGTGRDNLITLDIGGTTAKASLVEQGEVKLVGEYHIERSPVTPGYPIKIPVVDIVEIGAGGGSIAWIDPAGALRVGPLSAGADPGPACYGAGGEEPTLTDANLIAGRIDPDYFLGGRLRLDPERSRRAFAGLADRLGQSIEAMALGVIRIANANMIHLLRLVSVRRGRDPREFALVAFGGGGSLHATTLGRELRIPEVIVPRQPGHFSAWGMLMSDIRHDLIQTRVAATGALRSEDYDRVWRALEADLGATFAGEGFAPDEVALLRSADMRYLGQEHTVTVRLPEGGYDDRLRAEADERFSDAHDRAYGFRLDSPVEFVNFRAAGVAVVPKPRLRAYEPPGGVEADRGTRTVDFGELGRLESALVERDGLAREATVAGPAVVEEPAASTLVLPGQEARLDEFGNLVISTGVADGRF